MAQGPPTPPPMSATELQDEARDSILNAGESSARTAPGSSSAPTSVTANAPAQTSAVQDIYQQLFPRIVDLVSRGEFVEITRLAEGYDLNSEGDRSYSRLLLIAPLVLSYLVLDDLAPAQFALTRLPDNLASHPLSRILTRLLASTCDRKYENIYARAQDLFSISQQPDFPDSDLAKVVASMITTFVDTFRHRTFALLSRAYASLPISAAQIYLGLGSEEIISIATNTNWQYDAPSQTLHSISSTQVQNIATVATSAPSGLSTFHLVATGLTRLEF
ncbi:hypothetical protein BV22DRAFT_1036186 [Leucogyrophana mollusca]|uniref:Uncharacterized protein n=1 Tax=Leucogyrophana mollusca TaxID=85980 RepID=A0ACB8BCM5_9AGAM|nr:hypothetical protein BV22DRAFT_1036186 [Leucogyrophana mollusca]